MNLQAAEIGRKFFEQSLSGQIVIDPFALDSSPAWSFLTVMLRQQIFIET